METWKDIRRYLVVQIDRLYYAYYGKTASELKLKDYLDFITVELKKFEKVQKRMLDETYKEVLENYTLYRQFNPAVYMTAWKNVTRK